MKTRTLTSHLPIISIVGKVQLWANKKNLLIVRDDSAIVTDILVGPITRLAGLFHHGETWLTKASQYQAIYPDKWDPKGS